jgi:hypothetical protein
MFKKQILIFYRGTEWEERNARMDNQEKLATLSTEDTRGRKTKQKTPHNICWKPLFARKHK